MVASGKPGEDDIEARYGGLVTGPVKVDGSDVVVDVWVVPSAARTEIVGLHGPSVKIRVAAPAERGAANGAAAEVLRAHLGGTAASVVAGSRNRRKKIRVAGVAGAHAARRLGVADPP